MVLNENVNKKIIPIAGGKGGVGKSVIGANMALSLALHGKKTVLVDLDLGGSNLHTLLGIRNINPGIGNFAANRRFSMVDLVCPTEWENLFFIPGDVLVYGLSEASKSIKSRISKGLLDVDADYIIVDLGAGTSFTVVDFFLVSNSGLIVTTPQITGVMNAYSFLKNYVFRFLQRIFASNKDVSAYMRRMLKEKKADERHTVAEILDEITSRDKTMGDKAHAFLEVLQPKIILNKIQGPGDLVLAEGLRDLCSRNLSVQLECLGTVMNDPLIDASINKQRPFIVDNPQHITAESIHRICQKIMQSNRFPHMPLELDYYSDSFELAHIETENDVAALETEEEEAGHNVDKLLHLIRMQQSRIEELQGTLRMLSIGR